MVKIEAVITDSIAAELELEAGDFLLAINGQEVSDCIDARFMLTDEQLLLEVRKADGELWELEVEKDLHDDLGLEFEHPEPKSCGNKCIFCFVHQLPRGLRPSLYLMDEDYRFSFLYGSYVTLSNLAEAELQRIICQQLSPLYVSVHTTSPELRNRMLRREVEPVLPVIKRLLEGGIQLHTQIVVCPGWNDGDELEQTVADLAALGDGILSLALVPVGLTGHRHHLPPLRVPTQAEAVRVIQQLHGWQRSAVSRRDGRWVFAADEWYLRAGAEIPDYCDYEDFPQLENGVGLIAHFRHLGAQLLRRIRTQLSLQLTTVTGTSFYPELQDFADQLQENSGVSLQVVPIRNMLFAGEVSVAGLTSGRDLIDQLRGLDCGAALLIPDIMLKDGTDCFLDDVSLEQIAAELQLKVIKIESTPQGLWQGVRKLATMQRRKGLI